MNFIFEVLGNKYRPENLRDDNLIRKTADVVTKATLVLSVTIIILVILHLFLFALIIGFLFTMHLAGQMAALQTELNLRKRLRLARLALPYILADGVNGGEVGNVKRVALSIYARSAQTFDSRLEDIFDCLIYDLLDESPTLKEDLINFGSGF